MMTDFMELLLGQFLVLGFTLLAWWLARRDLSARAAQSQAPAIAEWERLRDAVETLIADLERRAAAAEGRIADAEGRLRGAAPRGRQDEGFRPPVNDDAPTRETGLHQAEHEESYAPVYAMADAGVSDAGEIARKTGLGQGEVELILGLRARTVK